MTSYHTLLMNLSHPFSVFLQNLHEEKISENLLLLHHCIHFCRSSSIWVSEKRITTAGNYVPEVMVAALALSNYSISPLNFPVPTKAFHPISFRVSGFLNLRLFAVRNGLGCRNLSCHVNRLRVSVSKNSGMSKEVEDEEDGDPSVPSWAEPGSDEPPPWARNEAQKESSSFEVPFYLYLLASVITAIAAVNEFLF